MRVVESGGTMSKRKMVAAFAALGLTMGLGLSTIGGSPSQAAPSAPQGYRVDQLVGQSSLGPVTGLTELPDGDLLIGHQRGTVRRYDAATGAVSTFATVPIAVGPDGAIGVSGLLDVLYLPASETAPEQVIVSFTCFRNGAAVHCLRVLSAAGQVVSTNKYGDRLFRWQNPGSHNGGGLAHDDQFLYVGTGDDTHSDDIAQDLDSLKGKILRFDRTRLSTSPTIVAYGIRQPYGMFMNGDELIEFDVGKDANEEINRITPDPVNPPNMGWRIDGDGDASAWLSYPHSGPDEPWGFAVIGGDIWANGRLYFADHPRGLIFSVSLDDPNDVQVFSSGWEFPTNLFTHSDGSMTVGLRTGAVWRIVPDSTPPVTTSPATTVPGATTTTTTTTTPGPSTTIGFSVAPRVDFSFSQVVTWSVSLAHDDSDDGSGYHTHPQIPDTYSDSGSFSVERPVGHEASNIWWEVTAIADDGTVQKWRVDGVDIPWTELDVDVEPPPTTAPTTTLSPTTTVAPTTTLPPTTDGNVTYVAGSNLPSKDAAFVDRLRSLGYSVDIVVDDDLDGSALTNTVAVISTSVNPSLIDDEVAEITVPIVTFEVYLAHEIGAATGPNWAAGEANLAGSTVGSLAPHPITAGLTDPAEIFDAAGQRWNRVKGANVAADAQVLGTASGLPVLVVNDDRRSVLLPWTWGSMGDLTDSGFQLFEQSVGWASS